MAETLTYQNTNDTATDTESLTTEEQEALKVGESLEQQQEQLLAGKYKDAEELEKAYVELQKKLGEKGNEDSGDAGDSETTDGEETEEKEEETEEVSEAVTLINEAAAEYWDNEQSLKPETIEKLNGLDSKELLNAYLEVQKNAKQDTPQTPEPVDLTEKEIATVQDITGGDAEYKKVMSWASSNLPKEDIEAFDEVIASGKLGAIKLAVTGLKAQYENANGYEGRMLSGKAPKSSGDVFRSQAELVRAMSDPRYDNDPAYRQDVINKLERSDNVQF